MFAFCFVVRLLSISICFVVGCSCLLQLLSFVFVLHLLSVSVHIPFVLFGFLLHFVSLCFSMWCFHFVVVFPSVVFVHMCL